MESLTKLYVRIREFNQRLSKGQAMTEYALIMSAVAVVVVFVTYQVMGQDVKVLVNKINTGLTVAS